MDKVYTSLGLMSGTSGDGIDASIIKSNGKSSYEVITNKYFEYEQKIFNTIHNLKENIQNVKDLNKYSNEILKLEKNITLYHAKVINEILKNYQIDIIGFHGQTIYHSSEEKISKQIGEGKLLLQLTQKNIVYNFRQNDIKNGGEGAPLTPIFHKLISKQKKIKTPVCILNIGGISNITIIESNNENDLSSRDIGPGNCLIDLWIRKNSEKKFDKNGDLAARGTSNEIILEQGQELYVNRPNKTSLSFDVNDFDVSFVRGLSLEDGAATLTQFTGKIISASLLNLLHKQTKKNFKVLISGGGRKNKTLVDILKKMTTNKISIELIDNYGVDGDYVESQAFAFLAIRCLIGEPITFPKTTGCNKPCTGGDILKIT